jgi:hypothetical protein
VKVQRNDARHKPCKDSILTEVTTLTEVFTLKFFRALSSVVRQMQGYNSQRRGTARISQFTSLFFPCNCFTPGNCYVCCVLCILCTVGVQMYTTATGCQANCSLIIIIIITIIIISL